MSLSEIKREEILSRRIEEVQKKIDRRDLKRMIKSLAGARGSTDELEESEQPTTDAPPPTTKAPRLKPLPEDYFSQSLKVRHSNEQKLFVGSWIVRGFSLVLGARLNMSEDNCSHYTSFGPSHRNIRR